MMIRRFTVNNVNNNVNDTKVITFYIDNTAYEYEEGMTWEEWINSEYNRNNAFKFDGDYIYHANNPYFYVYYHGGIDVKKTDYILENVIYSFAFKGGAGN